jgi:hypothetical protein
MGFLNHIIFQKSPYDKVKVRNLTTKEHYEEMKEEAHDIEDEKQDQLDEENEGEGK